MAADAKTVMELRDRTGAGVMDCKAALQASDGNRDSASSFFRRSSDGRCRGCRRWPAGPPCSP